MRLARHTTTAPARASLPDGYAHGLRTLADDIDAGNTTAIELAADGEMTPEDIAAYPTSPSRLGEPGPGTLPGAA